MTNAAAFLYKWTHIPTGKWYIGSRTAKGCSLTDGYICSSIYVKPLIQSDPMNWKRDVLVIGESKYIRALENSYLKLIGAKEDVLSFNRSNNASLNLTSSSIEGKIRITNGSINLTIFPTELELYVTAGWTLGFSDAVKNNMKKNHANVSGKNNPMFGTTRPGNNLGYKHTDQSRQKMRGPKSDNHKLALSASKQGNKNPMFGAKQNKKECPHCGNQIAVNAYSRWHGNNCKILSNTPTNQSVSEALVYLIEEALIGNEVLLGDTHNVR